MDVLSARYSVTPKYFFLRKYFFDIGPLISLSDIPDFNNFRANSKLFLIYLLDFLEIFSKGFFEL